MKEKLNIEFQKTMENINKDDWKFYNMNTLRNLVFHFDNISESDKEKVYDVLNNYMVFIRNYKIEGNKKSRVNQANQLYSEFLFPLIKFYVPLGFKANFSWLVASYIFVFALPLMLMLKCNIIWFIALLILIIALKIYSNSVASTYKTYGPIY